MTLLAVFDCDGTLVDSQRRIVASVQAAWNRLCWTPPPEEAIRRVVGLSLPEALAVLAPEADAAQHAALLDGFRQTFHRLTDDPAYAEPLYPGVEAALAELDAAGVVLGIATGKGRRGLANTLEHTGLAGRFAILKTADDGPSKPHPQILMDAIAEMGAQPETTVMLGDTAYDMAMAKGASAHALGVAWGYHDPADLTANGASAILHAYAEAAPAVLGLIGRSP